MKKLLAVALLAACATPAFAADKSYTYVEGGYINDNRDADGAYVRGSYGFDNGLYVHGQYAHLEADDFDFDYQPAELGLGWHHGLNDRVDFLAEAAAVRVDTDFGDANGYRASVGLRGDISPSWEGLAKVNYTDGDDFRGDTTGTVGVHYKFGRTWGAVAEVSFGNGAEAAQVGLRARF